MGLSDKFFDHLGFWGLISLCYIFLYLNLIELALTVFPVAMIIRFVVFMVGNYRSMDKIFIKKILGRKHFVKIQEYILKNYFGLITNHSLNNRAFSEICIVHQEYLPRILLFLVYHPVYSQQLPLKTQTILDNYQQSNFSTYQLNQMLFQYRHSVSDLTALIVKRKKYPTPLPKPEFDRFLCECGVSERQLLENTLPANHPILHEIQRQNQVFLSNGFLLLL